MNLTNDKYQYKRLMYKINDTSNILIIRNDKLGDFMLTFPVYSLLKKAVPHIKIHVLIPKYTEPMARLCKHIDNIIIDPGKQANFRQQTYLYHSIKEQNFDAVICLYSTTRIGIINFLSRIPYRIAPATKLAQLFYNHRLKQSRSKSKLPEYVYNLDLARQFLSDFNLPNNDEASGPYLEFPVATKTSLKSNFLQENNLTSDKKLIFVHPGSGGSANNLSILQFCNLMESLYYNSKSHIIVTFGPDESVLATKFSAQLENIPHTIFISQNGLENFTQHINIANLFISGSTGPLHVAGALDVLTVGFYPKRRSATATRWKTLNSERNHIAFSPEQEGSEDMSTIDIKQVSRDIVKFYNL